MKYWIETVVKSLQGPVRQNALRQVMCQDRLALYQRWEKTSKPVVTKTMVADRV